ncbi:EI24 domain-containing protein [Phytohabitans kaempferiae]|uniref:EI24 domain-containing protein n=1 Tax=Phytohabitans kaempferiae TaxID=1620943 RepID=A0ABV6M140_9ACTN
MHREPPADPRSPFPRPRQSAPLVPRWPDPPPPAADPHLRDASPAGSAPGGAAWGGQQAAPWLAGLQPVASQVSDATVRAAALAGAAGRQTARGAKRVGAGIGHFFVGVGYVFVGAGRFLGTPRLWLLVLCPLALTAAALFGLHEVTDTLVRTLVGWMLGFTEGWPVLGSGLVEFVVSVCVTILFHAAVTALTVPLTMFFGAAFLPFLTRAVLGGSAPVTAGQFVAAPVKAPAWHRAAWLCLRQTVVVAVVLQAGWAVIIPLLWIPGVNLAAAVAVGLVFNGFLVGLLVLAVPMHHHGLRRLGEQFRFAWRHRAYTLGFGITSLCVLIPPVLSLRLLVLVPIPPVVAAPGVVLYLVTVPAVLTGGILLFGRITAPRPGQLAGAPAAGYAIRPAIQSGPPITG